MRKAPDNPRTHYSGYDRFPELIDDIEKRIATHNQNAAAYSGSPLENVVKDFLRSQRAKGEVRLSDLEDDANKIDADIASIRAVFLVWSRAIEFGQQRGIVPKADCCPTVFTILSQVWS